MNHNEVREPEQIKLIVKCCQSKRFESLEVSGMLSRRNWNETSWNNVAKSKMSAYRNSSNGIPESFLYTLIFKLL